MAVQVLWMCLLLIAGSSASYAEGNAYEWNVQELCDNMVKKFNMLVDMVPFITTITFPSNNDYFVGTAEVIFYPAQENNVSPVCTVFYDKDLTMFRVDVVMKIVILNQGSRMEISECRLEVHLRLQKDKEYLFLEPLLVDVQIPGSVTKDGVSLDKKRANEILRPTLMKGFTSLASQHLSYSGSISKALSVDPSAATSLFKQLFMSYVSQIVK